MTEQLEQNLGLTEAVVGQEPLTGVVENPDTGPRPEEPSANGQTPTVQDGVPQGEAVNGVAPGDEPRRWLSEAGRKGAHRIHQLIQEGKLYEKEHGLKSGRQRLRQLIELGKLYEHEHGLRPARKKHPERLSRVAREELLTTLLRCLLRIAKPSFRAELVRLLEALPKDENGHAA
jgi:hypothetical protein